MFVLVLVLGAVIASASSAGAQSSDVGLQRQVADAVLDRGWWDESGSLPTDEMASLVERWGGEFAFAYTDRAFDVREDPALSATALLAQSTLEFLAAEGGPDTLLFVTGADASGATTSFPYPNVVTAMQAFDQSDVVRSFDDAAASIAAAGAEFAPQPIAQSGFFDGARLFIVLGLVTAVLALASLRSSRRKKSRQVHTADAKDDTSFEIQQMSDLILDLEPRITIADDPSLAERYASASKTYSEVLERAGRVDSGHDVADLRIQIAKARWKLDVIDAELEGRHPPDEPFLRNTSGSAWDSTRGTGGEGKGEIHNP